LGISILGARVATCTEMIPVIRFLRPLARRRLQRWVALAAALATASVAADAPVATPGARTALAATASAAAGTPAVGGDAPAAGTPASGGDAAASSSSGAAAAAGCLATGDGYLRARVAGAIDATIDWPNSGTRCQGESKSQPPGVRLSFQRAAGGKPNLLFVFGLTGVREGQPAHAAGVNLTLILQGTNRIFGTLGDSRCTVDSLTQRPMPAPGAYRVEARGFCTQPAHAVRGDGDVLVSTFEFAGVVNYETPDHADREARK
jgi:hypothetical protein